VGTRGLAAIGSGVAGLSLAALIATAGAAPFGVGGRDQAAPADAGPIAPTDEAESLDAGPALDLGLEPDAGPAEEPEAGKPAPRPHGPIKEPVYGQVFEPEPPPIDVAELRDPGRLVFGIEIGVGQLDALCSGCSPEGGIALAVEVGIQVSPRLALLLDISSLLHLLPTDDEGARGVAGHSQAVLAGRTWINPRLWLEGGAGLGAFHVSGVQDDADFGPGLVFAIGQELKHRPTSGIDISARTGGTIIDDRDGRTLLYSVVVLAGFHWN
jgi:hypothetical protein